MKRIDKIYRDKPSAEELYDLVNGDCRPEMMPCFDGYRQCCIDYLNQEVPDTEFIEKLKAIKLIFPQSKILTMDKNGKAFIFNEKTVHRSSETWVSRCASRYIKSLNGYSNNWENSLIDIDKVLKEEENGTIC